MELDIKTIVISGVVGLIGLFHILFIPQKLPTTVYWSIRSFMTGFLILLFVMMGNSLIEGYWDLNYIFDFLCLKKVGRWSLRVSASIGYITMLWGFASFLVIKVKKRL